MSDATDREGLAARLDALEMRVAYQDSTIEDLNTTITDQWREMDRLKRALARLEDQLREVEAGGGPSLPEPPPPHY